MTFDEWPQWLRNADTQDARVDIVDGCVVWFDGKWLGGEWLGGEWLGGLWHDGVWCSGVWRDGFWYGGVWYDGVWHGGFWYGGLWRDGVWRGGIWRDGVWRDGEWHGGKSSSTRCMYRVTGSPGHVHIGCQTYELDVARALCQSGELPDDAPARESDAGRLLRAAVLAQIAYQEALQDDD